MNEAETYRKLKNLRKGLLQSSLMQVWAMNGMHCRASDSKLLRCIAGQDQSKATTAKSPTCVALVQAPLRGRGWGEGEQAASRMRPKTTYNYDPNGNLLALNRNGDAANLNMDDFTYHYETNRNRLTHVIDPLGNVTGNDLPNQAAGNYRYDAMGNLVADVSEEIADIEWDVRGKVRKVTRTAGSTKSDLEFFYDALGQRVMKVERKKNVAVGGVLDVTTIYVRDATGNVMAVYTNERVRVAGDPSGPVNTVRNTLTLDEHHLYGSSRLGMETYENVVLADVQVFTHPVFGNIVTAFPVTVNDEFAEQRELKKKRYELTDHRGNVNVTLSDRKISVEDGSTGVTSHYLPDVISYADYYPFGAIMPGRNFNSSDSRYGFNGKEKDPEIKGEGNSYDFGARMYDPRLGRFLSIDPKSSYYPDLSPYCFAANSPIVLIDQDGEGPVYVVQCQSASDQLKSYIQLYTAGDISYERLQTAIQDVMNMNYTSGEKADYLRRMYAASDLTVKYNPGYYIDDPNWNEGLLDPAPYVAYKKNETADAVTTIILTEQGADGKWVQNVYQVIDPLKQQGLESSLVQEWFALLDQAGGLSDQLADLNKKLEHEKIIISVYEDLLLEDKSGGGGNWGPVAADNIILEDAKREAGRLEKQIKSTQKQIDKVERKISKKEKEIGTNKSYKGKKEPTERASF